MADEINIVLIALFIIYLEDVENVDLIHVGDEEYSKEQSKAAEEIVPKWDFKKQNYFVW